MRCLEPALDAGHPDLRRSHPDVAPPVVVEVFMTQIAGDETVADDEERE